MNLLRSTRQGYFNLFRPDVCVCVCKRAATSFLHITISFSCAEYSNIRLFFYVSAACPTSEHQVRARHLSALGGCMHAPER